MSDLARDTARAAAPGSTPPEPFAPTAVPPDPSPAGATTSGPAAPRRVAKPWGHELIWALTDRYCGKILVIEAGKRLSLQRHEVKDEWIHLLSGRLRLFLEDDDGGIEVRELRPGDGSHVPVGRIHRYEAIERAELLEVSTPELDDVVRLEDDYGREGTPSA